MAWIELHEGLPTHRKTMALRRLLAISRAQAVGHMCMLWLWCLENAQRGDLSSMQPQDIAEAAGWPDNPEKFVAALTEVGFLDAMHIHDWDDYAGRLIEQRERRRAMNRQRQRQLREKLSTLHFDPIADQNVADNYAPTAPPTVPNQNQPNQNDQNNQPYQNQPQPSVKSAHPHQSGSAPPPKPTPPYPPPFTRLPNSSYYSNQRTCPAAPLNHLKSDPFKAD